MSLGERPDLGERPEPCSARSLPSRRLRGRTCRAGVADQDVASADRVRRQVVEVAADEVAEPARLVDSREVQPGDRREQGRKQRLLQRRRDPLLLGHRVPLSSSMCPNCVASAPRAAIWRSTRKPASCGVS